MEFCGRPMKGVVYIYLTGVKKWVKTTALLGEECMSVPTIVPHKQPDSIMCLECAEKNGIVW